MKAKFRKCDFVNLVTWNILIRKFIFISWLPLMENGLTTAVTRTAAARLFCGHCKMVGKLFHGGQTAVQSKLKVACPAACPVARTWKVGHDFVTPHDRPLFDSKSDCRSRKGRGHPNGNSHLLHRLVFCMEKNQEKLRGWFRPLENYPRLTVWEVRKCLGIILVIAEPARISAAHQWAKFWRTRHEIVGT